MEQAVTDGYCLFKIVRTERRTDMTLQIIYPDHFVRSEISQIRDAVMLSNLKIVRILFIQVSAGRENEALRSGDPFHPQFHRKWL